MLIDAPTASPSSPSPSSGCDLSRGPFSRAAPRGRHPLEFRGISSHENHPVSDGLRRYPQIIRTNRPTNGLELVAYVGVYHRCSSVDAHRRVALARQSTRSYLVDRTQVYSHAGTSSRGSSSGSVSPSAQSSGRPAVISSMTSIADGRVGEILRESPTFEIQTRSVSRRRSLGIRMA